LDFQPGIDRGVMFHRRRETEYVVHDLLQRDERQRVVGAW
jgi:hypothetical protein